MTTERPLSVGIELEFAVVHALPEEYIRKVCESQTPPYRDVQDAYIHARRMFIKDFRQEFCNDLIAEGISACVVDESIPQDDSISPLVTYNEWRIHDDFTIRPPADGKYTLINGTILQDRSPLSLKPDYIFIQMEVSSRILLHNSRSWKRLFQTEICTVLSVIHHYQVYINSSCGFHVHVGHYRTGFSLRTLKNLLSLMAICQQQTDQIHPPDRLNSQYCNPITSFAWRDELVDKRKLRAIIEKQSTIEELVQLVHRHKCLIPKKGGEWLPNKYFAYNFLELRPRAKNGLKTIEFRQHEATLDPATIFRWIEFVVGIVRVCAVDPVEQEAEIEPARVRDVEQVLNRVFAKADAFGSASVHGHRGKARYSVLEMLSDLGLSKVADLFAGHVFENHVYPGGLPRDGWLERRG
jgi:hypothetical protein